MSASHVVAVFPQGLQARTLAPSARRWLSRGEVVARRQERERMLDVLDEIGVPAPSAGLAALRYLGQRGAFPTGWLAAADPAHLETRLRHLVVRPFRPGDVGDDELAAIAMTIREVLADDGTDIEPVESAGYLRAPAPMATATCSAESAAGRLPDEFMPAGAAASSFHRLQSEIQMLLHDHPVNEERRRRGAPVINTLWIWGGGEAAESGALELPALYGADPLYRGFWSGHGQPWSRWEPGAVEAALAGRADAVIVVPDQDERLDGPHPVDVLDRLHGALKAGRVGRLTLLFGDDLVVRVRRGDLLKFWRGVSSLLGESNGDD